MPEGEKVIHWVEGKLDEGRSREEQRERECKAELNTLHKQIDGYKKTLNEAQQEVIKLNLGLECVKYINFTRTEMC